MNKKLLHKYFAGEATSEEEEEIMDWVVISPDNYNKYLEERKYWNAILVNYDSLSKRKSIKQKKNLHIWAISTIAVSIALIFFILYPSNSSDKQENKWHSVYIPPGQRAQITLEDGSKVWLNSQTTLVYPASFAEDKRVVKLNGEGFFEVKKSKDIPFIVETNKYNIRVLGTKFNVFSYENYNLFETSLLSGSVEILPVNKQDSSFSLRPDEKVSDYDGILRLSKISNFDHFRWKEGLICLDDERFEDLIKKFSLYFDIKIIVKNRKLLDYRCTGKFRQNDGVDYALKVLQKDMKFDYTRNNESGEIIIQ